MNQIDFQIAALCERCRSLHESLSNPCTRCGASAVRPFYDYYKIFSLRPGFSESELVTAYRKSSLKFHPDVNPAGKEMFLLISEAFKTLKDPGLKTRYDELRMRALGGGFEAGAAEEWQEEEGGEWTEETMRQQSKQYEDIFREFHRFRQGGPNLARVSRISGNLGAILGAVVGVFFGIVGAIPGGILGYAVGRSNPGLAPIFLSLANLLLFVGTLGGAFVMLVWAKNIPFLLVLLFVSWLLFGMFRGWARELFSGPAEDSSS